MASGASGHHRLCLRIRAPCCTCEYGMRLLVSPPHWRKEWTAALWALLARGLENALTLWWTVPARAPAPARRF
jgi:hypothetical protein